MFRSSSSSGSWFSSWALRASCASDTHRSAAYRLLLLCRWDLRHRDNVSTHLSLQLLLVHVSVFAHQHSVCRRRSANLRSPLAQTHPNTHTHTQRERERETHTRTHRERDTHTHTVSNTRSQSGRSCLCDWQLPGLQLIVINSVVVSEDEEVVLLVSFTGLVLHVPVVLASDFIIIPTHTQTNKTHAHKCAHTHAVAQTHTNVHMYTHTRTHTHAYTHTNVHTHTQTHTTHTPK